jgi:Uncharacterized small protein (DUF2158)
MNAILLGDVVRLKSGSANFTVIAVYDNAFGDANIEVAWYNTVTGDLRRQELPADALELASARTDVPSDDATELEPAECHLLDGRLDDEVDIYLGDGD